MNWLHFTKSNLGQSLLNRITEPNYVFNPFNGIDSDLLDEQNKTSLNSMLENLKEGIEEHYAAQQGIYKLVNDLSAFTSKDDIKKMLKSKAIKQAGGLSYDEINNES